ncbi:MAG: nicotinamide mononucleotide transporter [Crocinitomicaceae bacterium]|nr:nicotinamide mononucleotide transporter [Crocinitomicaceae bacterium]MBK8926265.1 nicotinamide mononucleotide transporter [Crocinitomicaceae bacterium]
MSIFDIHFIVFELIGYKVSFVEFIGTTFGFISVYLATRANILTWTTGIINELFLFILFFQVQLYADMFLQIFFFVVTIFGWYNWKKNTGTNSVSKCNNALCIKLSIFISIGTLLMGLFMMQIHLLMPAFFPIPAAYPFVDSTIMILSFAATYLLARKKIETWYVWILVDIICVVLFFQKQIAFLAFEYMLFMILALYGLIQWKKQMRHE